MKKLGKPGAGYGDMRKLTAGERKATGLPARVEIMVESGTGLVTFWEPASGGGYDRYLYVRESEQQRNALDAYWSA